MAYAAPFHRLVLIGNLYADTFNTTLSIMPAGGSSLGAVTPELLEDMATFIASWYPRTLGDAGPFGLSLIGAAALTSIKLNRIGTDGRYMDAEAMEHEYPSPIPGGGAGTPPAQLSIAATLVGPAPRARAGKGRMFFPPSNIVGTVGADGRLTTTNVTRYANGVHDLLAGINDVYFASAGFSAVAGIASEVGAGAFQAVTEIRVGRTVDTIRSRRNRISEDYFSLEF